MDKDFDSWNIEKKETHKLERTIVFNVREIWWVKLGLNVGVEIDGKHELFMRPALIIKKFNSHMVLVLPITSKEKIGKYYFQTSSEDNKSYTVCISQIKAISTKRLFRKIGMIKKDDLTILKSNVSRMILA